MPRCTDQSGFGRRVYINFAELWTAQHQPFVVLMDRGCHGEAVAEEDVHLGVDRDLGMMGPPQARSSVTSGRRNGLSTSGWYQQLTPLVEQRRRTCTPKAACRVTHLRTSLRRLTDQSHSRPSQPDGCPD